MKTADERIEELIARTGSPLMLVKSGEQNRFSNHMKEIDEIACEKAKELKILKSNAIIMVLCDEIEMMDDQITDMANTIDRLEAALYNTLNEREQLKKDLHEAATWKGFLSLCTYCAHKDADCFYEPCKTCIENSKRPNFEWRGVPEVKDDDA